MSWNWLRMLHSWLIALIRGLMVVTEPVQKVGKTALLISVCEGSLFQNNEIQYEQSY